MVRATARNKVMGYSYRLRLPSSAQQGVADVCRCSQWRPQIRSMPCADVMRPLPPEDWWRSSRSTTSSTACPGRTTTSPRRSRCRRCSSVASRTAARSGAGWLRWSGGWCRRGRRTLDRLPDDQRPGGDRGREAGLPAGVQRPPLHAACRRLLRVVRPEQASRPPSDVARASRRSSRSSSTAPTAACW